MRLSLVVLVLLAGCAAPRRVCLRADAAGVVPVAGRAAVAVLVER